MTQQIFYNERLGNLFMVLMMLFFMKSMVFFYYLTLYVKEGLI